MLVYNKHLLFNIKGMNPSRSCSNVSCSVQNMICFVSLLSVGYNIIWTRISALNVLGYVRKTDLFQFYKE